MKFLLLLPATVLAAPVPQLNSLLRGAGLGGTTRNDIEDGVCAPVTVIHARGTTEPGNVGIIAGPPFFDALKSSVGKIAVQGVNDYPADVAGFLAGGSDSGAEFMADAVGTALKNCANTKIVLSGYSQGAQVVHKAAAQLTADEQASVAGIVVFGDPENGLAFPGKLNGREKTFCNNGDLICDGSPIIAAPHLQYGRDAEAAAEFVKGQVA